MSKLKSDDTFGIDGEITEVTLVKSRTNKAGQSVPLVFDQENGFDPDLSLFLFLKQRNKINGAGAYLYLGDRSDIKFSQKAFKEKLYSNPELMAEFNKIVIEELQTMLSKQSEVIFQEKKETSTSMILDMIKNVA